MSTDWFGLACPSHCHPASFSALGLFFLLGFCAGSTLAAWLILSFLRILLPTALFFLITLLDCTSRRGHLELGKLGGGPSSVLRDVWQGQTFKTYRACQHLLHHYQGRRATPILCCARKQVITERWWATSRGVSPLTSGVTELHVIAWPAAEEVAHYGFCMVVMLRRDGALLAVPSWPDKI